ncbi:hypothetical protein CesoFtcFv8_013336 [Champsocephalus esox]|uniref:Uncharacterized protein n=1 Tax=Champsocephalus esox TaxID=159716 RepID=A0AAN8GRX9_9TELE|nr:hypothetical protein CesoFtcFv8_013336 [Champsocephalus esox]
MPACLQIRGGGAVSIIPPRADRWRVLLEEEEEEEEERQLREAALRQTFCRKTERDTGRNRERHREQNREEPRETGGETVETEPCCRTPAPGLTVRFSPTPLLSSAGETSSLSAPDLDYQRVLRRRDFSSMKSDSMAEDPRGKRRKQAHPRRQTGKSHSLCPGTGAFRRGDGAVRVTH